MKVKDPAMRRCEATLAIWLIITAWLIFITSFFLPVTNAAERGGTAPGTPLAGWEALWTSISVICAQPFVVFAEPRALLFLTFPLINLIMLGSPLVILGEREWAPHLLALILLPSSLIPLALPKTLTGDLFIGFYAWIGSFFLMAVGCIWLGLSSRWSPHDTLKRVKQVNT